MPERHKGSKDSYSEANRMARDLEKYGEAFSDKQILENKKEEQIRKKKEDFENSMPVKIGKILFGNVKK